MALLNGAALPGAAHFQCTKSSIVHSGIFKSRLKANSWDQAII